MKSTFNFLLLFLLISSGLMAQKPYTGQATIKDGETFIVLSNMKINNLFIKDAGKLIIDSGVEFSYSGNFRINGNLEIRSNSGISATGSLQTGFGAKNKAVITMKPNSYFSTSGSWTQYDPHLGDASIEMADNTVVEICGTYTQLKAKAPYIHYTGTGKKAYFINKAPVTGMGTNELGDSYNIKWIVMDQLANLTPGQAQLCGPNAQQTDCPSIWPSWLTDKNECFEAREVAQTPLPVTLIHFSTAQKAGEVVLTWTTANEQNNKGFYIQSSLDGQYWKDEGFVSSKSNLGFSATSSKYQYTVTNPAKGINFFRLKQIDFDEALSFSNILSEKIDVDNQYDFYPNPVSDKLTILSLHGDETITIINSNGVEVKRIFIHGQNRVDVSMGELTSGVYLVKLLSPAQLKATIQKIIKQ